MSDRFQLSLAPEKLWQAINPFTFIQRGGQFGLINVDLGQTPHPEVEKAILDEVGSYGRQLGHMADALEVLLAHVHLEKLSQAEKDALDVLKGDLAKIRQVKQRALGLPPEQRPSSKRSGSRENVRETRASDTSTITVAPTERTTSPS